ncbi:hypothetical protein AeRB84_015334, partial [Aphanomyces euteiches]
GAFRGASERWPIVEKEAFAVVELCKRLEYLLIRPGGFRLFTDHRNLVYMFNPLGASPNMAKYQAHKLQRWSLTMTTFPYAIECVAGEENLWADLLSRWGSPSRVARAAKMYKLALVSPLQSRDMSGFVRLHASSTATAAETAAALMEWFSIFGVVKTWVSDCGSHFKNEVIDAMRRMFGSHHHFVTPHCPWANGTVEVVNRLIVRTLKALCSEMRLKATEWPSLLPLVQSALNQQPADRLGGEAPVKAFTGLGATPPLTGIVRADEADPKTIDWVKSEMAKYMADLAIALEEMHKEVKATADRKRAKARASRTKQRGVKLTKFALGDFVLVARALKHPGKLTLRWKGPCRVVRVLSHHLMEVVQLVPPRETTLHHACRLRLYHAGGRDVDEDLVAQIAFGDEGFYVEGIEDLRMHDGEWQLKIKWMGLEDAESSWEPALSIYEDVPLLFRRWTTTHHDEDGVSEMVEDIERAIGHPL